MKVKTIITKPCGVQIELVSEAMYGLGLTLSIGVYALYRYGNSGDWTLANDRPAPNWREMAVDNYISHGRSELLRLVKPCEIIANNNKLFI